MRQYISPLALASFSLCCCALMGCGDDHKGPMEKTGETIDKGAQKTGEVLKDGAQKTGEAVEKAGEKVKDAAK